MHINNGSFYGTHIYTYIFVGTVLAKIRTIDFTCFNPNQYFILMKTCYRSSGFSLKAKEKKQSHIFSSELSIRRGKTDRLGLVWVVSNGVAGQMGRGSNRSIGSSGWVGSQVEPSDPYFSNKFFFFLK